MNFAPKAVAFDRCLLLSIYTEALRAKLEDRGFAVFELPRERIRARWWIRLLSHSSTRSPAVDRRTQLVLMSARN